MRIVEEFETIQGEGKYLGSPSYFIRTTGCNLRCTWANKDGTRSPCDTPYTSFSPEKGYKLKERKVLKKLKKGSINHVVITGGEPTIQSDLEQSVKSFLNKDHKVTLETNGTNYIEGIEGAFISISPKLNNSYYQEDKIHRNIHTNNNHFIEPCRRWMENNEYQFKFVVSSPNDMIEILEIQNELQIPNENVYLMPQGVRLPEIKSKEFWMIEECIKHGFNYTPRIHINIWGNKRGV